MFEFVRTLPSDTGKGERVSGKDAMALRRYQNGYLVVRGKGSHKKWVARWRQDIVRTDGTIERRNRSQLLGRVEDISSREARRLLASLLKDEEQVQKEQTVMTFGEFACKWEDTVLPTYRSSTRYFYRNILHDHLLPHFKTHRLCDLQTADVQGFMNLKGERYSPSLLHHIRATLSRTYATAKLWGYVKSNPVLGTRLPQNRSVRPKVTFQPSQVMKILEQLEEPHRTMVSVVAVTGMRASELFGLKWPDVDFERRLLLIRRTYYRGEFGVPKSQTSERVIPLSPGLAQALQLHKQNSRRSEMDLVFPNAVGKPYEPVNLLKRVLYPTLKALGLPQAGWRVFRRSVATALSEMREPVRTAQQVLGHSSPQTTLTFYVQSVEESQRRAVAKLEEVMMPTCAPVAPQMRPSAEQASAK